MSQTAEKLEFPEAQAAPDPLLACLLMLARQYGLPASEFAVTAGLPLEEGSHLPQKLHEPALGVLFRLVFEHVEIDPVRAPGP